MKKQEIWRPIPGFEGYEVSSKGQVRSYFAKTGLRTWSIANTPQRTLKPSRDPRNYLGVCLRKNGTTHHKKIHRLVMLAFIGPCPDGLVACHNNDIRDDNQLENLRYDTQSENMRDTARNDNCLLSMQDVRDIRRRRASPESLIQIARDYDASIHLIRQASAGRAYQCVDIEVAPVNDYRRKLTPTCVSIIKWLLLNKAILRRDIAEHFEVHPSMITRIANGTHWAHITIA